MAEGGGLAGALEVGDPAAIREVGRSILAMGTDNLVERPWGSPRLLAYKGLPGPAGRVFGESFEVAAHSRDPEAREHPSLAHLPDGSTLPLPRVLQRAGDAFCGTGFARVHGSDLPLLPKFLAVRQLLSVQVHPPGNPEAYVILEADAGATLRLGFRQALSRERLHALLTRGFAAQDALARVLEDPEAQAWQDLLASSLAAPSPLPGWRERLAALRRPGVPEETVHATLEALRECYWDVLGLMNEIPVAAGMVIDNTQPGTRADALPCADVHALGNPARREMLLLEVRCPGPTLRAWDHVRFPRRPCQVEEALGLMSFRGTDPADFLVAPASATGSSLWRSVSNARFVVEHLRVAAGESMRVPGEEWLQTLHALRGAARVEPESGAPPLALHQGQSAVVAAGAGGLTVSTPAGTTELVRVLLPRP